MSELRKCVAVINGEKREGFFHGWSHYANVLEPSCLRGGHAGGQVSETYAIIEGYDGVVFRCVPEKVVFQKEKESNRADGCDVCKKYGVRQVYLVGNRDGLGGIKIKFCPECGRDLRGEK